MKALAKAMKEMDSLIKGFSKDAGEDFISDYQHIRKSAFRHRKTKTAEPTKAEVTNA